MAAAFATVLVVSAGVLLRPPGGSDRAGQAKRLSDIVGPARNCLLPLADRIKNTSYDATPGKYQLVHLRSETRSTHGFASAEYRNRRAADLSGRLSTEGHTVPLPAVDLVSTATFLDRDFTDQLP